MTDQPYEMDQSKERKFVCSWTGCGKAFMRKTDVTRHFRIHMNDRPFKCVWPGCSKAFMQRSAVKIHYRTHTGEKPNSCPFDGCNKSFNDTSSLARHRRTHHYDYPFPCSFKPCQAHFANRKTLLEHEQTDHVDCKKLSQTEIYPDEPVFYPLVKITKAAQDQTFQHDANTTNYSSQLLLPNSEVAKYSSHLLLPTPEATNYSSQLVLPTPEATNYSSHLLLPTPENTPHRSPMNSSTCVPYQSYAPAAELDYRNFSHGDFGHQFSSEPVKTKSNRESNVQSQYRFEKELVNTTNYRSQLPGQLELAASSDCWDYLAQQDRDFRFESSQSQVMHNGLPMMSSDYLASHDYSPHATLLNHLPHLSGPQNLMFQQISPDDQLHQIIQHAHLYPNSNLSAMHTPCILNHNMHSRGSELIPESQYRYQESGVGKQKRLPLRINTQVGGHIQPRSSFMYEQDKYDDRRYSAPIIPPFAREANVFGYAGMVNLAGSSIEKTYDESLKKMNPNNSGYYE